MPLLKKTMYDKSIRKSALVVAVLSSFVTPFMGSSVNIALPSIQREFRIDAVLLSWVATSYILAAAVCLVPFGRLADIYGRKRIFLYGIVLFTFASLAAASSLSVPVLILFRVFQGIGSAMIFATGTAILISVYPPHERGRVLGINVAAVYLGLSLGPTLGGVLTHHLTWRSVFLANVPLGLIIICLVLWRLKGEWAEARGETFDLTGALIYGMAIIAVMYGISLLPSGKGLWMILWGVICAWAFLKWEARVPDPVFETGLFRENRVFACSNVAALINYSATFAVTFLLSLYLQYIKGLTPQGAGVILVAQPAVMAAFSPFAGRLSDRIQPRAVASLGMFLTAVGLVFLAFLNRGTTLFFITATLVLLGLGFALFSSPNTNAVMSSVEKKFYGTASGTVGTMRLLGMMISMGIASLVFALFIGRVQITSEYHVVFIRGVRVAFMIFSILCFVGIIPSWVRGKLGRESEVRAQPASGPGKAEV